MQARGGWLIGLALSSPGMALSRTALAGAKRLSSTDSRVELRRCGFASISWENRLLAYGVKTLPCRVTSSPTTTSKDSFTRYYAGSVYVSSRTHRKTVLGAFCFRFWCLDSRGPAFASCRPKPARMDRDFHGVGDGGHRRTESWVAVRCALVRRRLH